MLNSILAMVICIILSGYFSATETSFSALNKTRLKVLAEEGNRRASLTLRLADNYDKLISTILIGNNIVNIAVASIGTIVFMRLLNDEQLGTTVSTVVVTLLVLIFGEITPKSIAKDYPEKFAMFSSPILQVLMVVFAPLNFIFSKWKQLVNRIFSYENDTRMSQEELLLLLDEVKEDGSIDEDESTLLKNAVEFGEMNVEDILTHRTDLIAIPVDASKAEMVSIFDNCSLSRLPVYEESIDQIIGVVHRMDFYTGGGVTDKDIRDIMTTPLFIRGTEKIDNVLKLLRNSKAHLAVAVDEYGGTLGIVTMEDILEELVGEIWDEHDKVEEAIKKIDDSHYEVDGGWSLDDFCRFFRIKTDSESVSVGGWVMDITGKIPQKGDRFTYDHLDITVTGAADHRVETISVAIPAKEEKAAEA